MKYVGPVLLAIALLLPRVGRSGDWPQWCGANRDNVGVGGPRLAGAWPSRPAKLWQSETINAGREYGYATPSVAAGRVYVFVTRQLGGQWKDVVYCLNASNGGTLWKRAYTSGRQSSYASSSSVCVKDGRAYVAGTDSKIYCMNATNGVPIWTVNMAGHWLRSEEMHSSFVVADGVAVIQGGQHDGTGAGRGAVAAFDAATGALLWIQPKFGGEGSPVIWEKNGKKHVLTVAGDGLSCHDLVTGRELWSAAPGGSSHTITVSGDHAVLVSDSYMDRGIACFHLATNRAEVVWQIPGPYDAGSPAVIHDGHIYAAASHQGENGSGSRGKVYCVELATGRLAWDAPIRNLSYACPVIADGKLFVKHYGTITMLEASPHAFRQLGKADFGMYPYISAAIVDGKLFARGPNNIACYDLREKANNPPVVDSGPTAEPNPVPVPQPATLTVAAHDPDNDPLSIIWRKSAGPGSVTFTTNDSVTSCSAFFDATGDYVLSAEVRDGRGGVVSNSVAVTVVTPGIVTDVAAVDVPEGGLGTFNVRLAAAPLNSTTVTVARVDGDADISVSAGAGLLFTPDNWGEWQPVTLAAAHDADASGDRAGVECSAPGIWGTFITVDEVEDDVALTVKANTDSYNRACGTVTPEGAAIVTMGTTTTITAVAKWGYRFVRWSVLEGDAAIADINAATTTVSVVSQAVVQAWFCDTDISISTRWLSFVPVPEGGTKTFRLGLSGPPAGTVTVNVARTEGDADIQVSHGAALIFTPETWWINRNATLAALEDGDASNGTATIVCSAVGLADVVLSATEADDDVPLTVSAGSGGVATPTGTVVVSKGIPVPITALPDVGYTFVNWTALAGVPEIGDPNSAGTTAILRESATLRANFTSDPGNRPPTISAPASIGPDPITLPWIPTARVTATDPDGDPLTYTWGKVSGSGSVTFDPNGTTDGNVTDVLFSEEGVYTLRVTVSDDDGGTASSDVSIMVNPVPAILASGGYSVPEGDTADLRVRLYGSKPSGIVTVTVERTEGDADISVQSGSVLIFAPSNYETYQTAVLAAAEDADAEVGTAVITLTSPEISARSRTTKEEENDTIVTIAASIGGSTTPSGATVVTKGLASAIGAAAAPGCVFSNWTVTAGSATIANAGVSNTTVTASEPATLLAGFVIVDPEGDSDGDGMKNRDEIIAGTDSTRADSVLCLSDPNVGAAGSELVLRWQSVSNRCYSLHAATSLLNGFDVELRTNLPATPPVNIYTDKVEATSCRFYRVRVLE